MKWTLLSALAIAGPRVVHAALYTDPASLPRTTYDYVVVGGGVGGGVVAARLSEDPRYRILLIEAGPSNEGILPVEIPLLCTRLSPNTPYTWNFTTTPQAGLDGRALAYPRGRLLGGSSSVNYMAWTRGSRDDYDRIAKVTGDIGWSWDALVPIMKSIETLTPPPDGRNTVGEIDPSIHGTNGPISVSLHMALPVDKYSIETSQELSNFPYTVDYNDGKPLGVSYIQAAIRNGSRVSSATGYIQPALAAHSTLDVLVNSHVVKILQTGSSKGVPVFGGVQFATSANGPIFTVNATREVILSAGSLGTPQLLMLSGIGNSSYLQSMGIKPLVNLPDVGQHLQDHPSVANVFNVNSSDPTTDDIRTNSTFAAEQMAEWQASGQGWYSLSPGAQFGYFRLPNNSPVFSGAGDPSAGPSSPHVEIIVSDGFGGTPQAIPATGRYLSLLTAVVSPSSRGSVTLASTDPFADPVVDPNFFSSSVDIGIMREAVKTARQFAAAPAWKSYIVNEYGPFQSAQTDADIEAVIRNSTLTVFHPVGTAVMAPFGSTHGVVNPDLTVKGTKGLRVVDASVFPFIPAAHTQAPTYIVAERAAILIRLAAILS